MNAPNRAFMTEIWISTFHLLLDQSWAEPYSSVSPHYPFGPPLESKTHPGAILSKPEREAQGLVRIYFSFGGLFYLKSLTKV